MIATNGACYYGRHVGCMNVNDPTCRRCAERLTNAVNQVVRPTMQKNYVTVSCELQTRGDNKGQKN
jgi:hypothetical protein